MSLTACAGYKLVDPTTKTVRDADPDEPGAYWHGASTLEVAYWRERAKRAEAMIVDYKKWLAMREENARTRFWHTPEIKEKRT